MKGICVLSRLAAVALLAGLVLFSPLPAGATGKVFTVDNDRVQCRHAAYTSIQSAVNAAPAGATIRVCAGVYNEQVAIDHRLKISGDRGAVIKPALVTANTTSLSSGAPIAAVVWVHGASGVELEGLVVDGASNGILGCAPNLIGIFYQNASGKINKTEVKNIRLGAGLGGCQSGQAIFVQSGGGGRSTVLVWKTKVYNYQKNGITGNEAGTTLLVKQSTATGIGATPEIAQNGIQIGFGATGSIEENTIRDHIYSPCVSTTVCGAASINILVYLADRVHVSGNTARNSQTNIYLGSNNSRAQDNKLFDAKIFDGIYVGGDNNRIESNYIVRSDEAGIFLDGNNNRVKKNVIDTAPIGIWNNSGTGNLISNNKCFHVGTCVQNGPTAVTSVAPTAAEAPARPQAEAFR
jgi:parallel beta-helix repeat protein